MPGTYHKPDTPFRSGISGKYKLLIKSVTPVIRNYDYALVDADGKEYRARSQNHYAKDQILRCMVDFKVNGAKLVVSDVRICSKQDLATIIPEPKKVIIKEKEVSKPKPIVPPAAISKRPSVKRKKLSMFAPAPDLAKSLMDLYGSLSGIEIRERSIKKEIGANKYKSVLVYARELEKAALRTVVTNKSLPEIAPPVKMVLKVAQLTEFGGEPCYKVKYSPDSQEPYDWYVPTQGIPDPERDEIHCVFYDHTMKLDPIWVSGFAFEVGNQYTFVVDYSYKTDSGLWTKLRDEYGLYHAAKLGQIIKDGEKVICRVKSYNPSDGALYCLRLVFCNVIAKTQTTSRAESTQTTVERSSSRTLDLSRRQMEIFDRMKEIGFHKCGKPFVCSCCGQSYDKDQGIVSDVKEIYLCNSCRGGQKKRERSTKSLRTISTPMGNKR